jgi:hypothetical protein
MHAHDRIPRDLAISRHVAQRSSLMEPSKTRHFDRINGGRHQADLRLGMGGTLELSPYSRSQTGVDCGTQPIAAWPIADTAMVPNRRRCMQDRTCLPSKPRDYGTAWATMGRAGSEVPAAATGAPPPWGCCTSPQ